MDNTEICPGCNIGSLIMKCGKYGPFFGCTEFPKCDYAESITDYTSDAPDAYIIDDFDDSHYIEEEW